MGCGFDPWTRFTRTHIMDYPFVEFGPLIRLDHRAIDLLSTEMTAQRSIMRLKDNEIL